MGESEWSTEEINALKAENGGGNKAALAKWYGKFDAEKERKPTPGDSMETYRRFIRKVYGEK